MIEYSLVFKHLCNADFTYGRPAYHYYFTDHLGSVRVSADDTGAVDQVNHYYPYGGLIGDLSYEESFQKYKYNGKELDRTHGLDMYDYGARFYSPMSPNWIQMDPLAEKYYNVSPYAYCGGNPVKYVDPDGKEKIYALEPNNEENKPIIIAAHKFQDNPNVVNIWAHGDSHSMSVYDKKTKHIIDIETGQQMHNFLMKNSHVYKNRKKGESISIVLHSCETGRTDNEGPSLAQKLSEQMDNVTITAPNEKVQVGLETCEEIGTYKTRLVGNKKYPDVKHSGTWNTFKNGSIIKQRQANDIPGSDKENKWYYFIYQLQQLFNL